MKSKENKFLSHVLKNHEVESKQRDKKANGESNINILTIIYLKEYEKIRFNKDKLKVPLINPSIEKISIDEFSIVTYVLILLINSEKEIGELKMFFPKSWMARVILAVRSSIIWTIEKE